MRWGAGVLVGFFLLASGVAAQEGPVAPDGGGADPTTQPDSAATPGVTTPAPAPVAAPAVSATPPPTAGPRAPAGTPEADTAGSGDAARQAAALEARALELGRAGDVAGALPLMRRAVELDPLSPRLWAGLGSLLLASGSPRLAADALERAIELEPRRAAYHSLAGDAHAALGDHARAWSAYERALAIDPRDASALQGRAALRSAPPRQPEGGPAAPYPGHAQVPRHPEYERPPRYRDEWSGETTHYRLELALAYLGAPVLIGVLGAAAGPVAVIGVFVPPAVHWVNGEVGRGFLALAGWPGFTIVGGLIGVAASQDCRGEWCGLEGFAIGALVGAIVWPIVDVATAPEVRKKAPERRVYGGLSLTATPLREGAALGVSGTF